MTFAVVGFISAFVVGVPHFMDLENKNTDDISEPIMRGYFKAEEQNESIGEVTFGGNIRQ